MKWSTVSSMLYPYVFVAGINKHERFHATRQGQGCVLCDVGTIEYM